MEICSDGYGDKTRLADEEEDYYGYQYVNGDERHERVVNWVYEVLRIAQLLPEGIERYDMQRDIMRRLREHNRTVAGIWTYAYRFEGGSWDFQELEDPFMYCVDTGLIGMDTGMGGM